MATTRRVRGNESDGKGNPRESMQVLPGWLQPILTEITGKAGDEQCPFRWTWWQRLALSIAVLVLGVSISIAAVECRGACWLLLPAGWLFTTSALRAFQTTFLHHASHKNLTGVEWIDRAIGDALSTIAWITPYKEYSDGHRHHHGKLALWEDVDLRFIVLFMGFVAGKSREAYWRHLGRLIISPRFHAMYLWARTNANLNDATLSRRLSAAAFLITAVALVSLYGVWFQFLLVWIVPTLWLYQVSGLLQVLTEHSWVRDPALAGQPREQHARLTTGRFVGTHVPAGDMKFGQAILAWIGWTISMGWQTCIRLFVLPGDLPSHDVHHLKPQSDWANAPYARRAVVADANQNAGPNYTEAWGLRAALNNTFDALVRLSARAELGRPLTYSESQDGYLSM